MSSVKISGDTSGVITLAAPAVAGTNTITLPASTGTLALESGVSGINKIINGDFAVNQRQVSGTVSLSSGEYGHDRFKGGSSGATYTFATSENVTTITITAGTLQQVIEGNNLQSGTHTLSWTGTAQGKIDSGSFAATGVTGTATGGTNLTVEFNTGTVTKVQFEPGSIATPFEYLLYTDQLDLCHRYYIEPVNDAAEEMGGGWYYNATWLSWIINVPTPMRVKPTATIAVGASNYTAFSDNAADAFNSGVLENSNNNHTTFSFYNNSEVSGTSGSGAMVRQTASAGSIKLSAEL